MNYIIDKKELSTWYFNFSASRHIYNSKEKFLNIQLKTYEFLTARGDIIRSEQV